MKNIGFYIKSRAVTRPWYLSILPKHSFHFSVCLIQPVDHIILSALESWWAVLNRSLICHTLLIPSTFPCAKVVSFTTISLLNVCMYSEQVLSINYCLLNNIQNCMGCNKNLDECMFTFNGCVFSVFWHWANWNKVCVDAIHEESPIFS